MSVDENTIQRWFDDVGAVLVTHVNRLWPHENDPGYRGQSLAEEVGEVNRAITKRRHASHAPDGRCKDKTQDQWTDELELELCQAMAVIIDIAHREKIRLASGVVRAMQILSVREPGT